MQTYRLCLLELDKCGVVFSATEMLTILRAWRRHHSFARQCMHCQRVLPSTEAYIVCCDYFYYIDRLMPYPVTPIAIPTPGYTFVLRQLERMIAAQHLSTQQDFLVLPDPIYWQVGSTLIYEKVMKFVLGLPMTSRTQHVQPPSKAPHFHEQVQKAPLNYGSLDSRSCGKATLIRQAVFGKRVRYSMRGMIVPDATLKPNEIHMPDAIVNRFGLRGQWVILNRMPTLQPENLVGLRVPRESAWPHNCFGIPLEILESINGDFDGDETNIYLVPSWLCQAECATLLNSESDMGSFVMGLKLAPCQDMLVAYYLFYEETKDILPIRYPGELKKSFQSIYDVYGSARAFRAFNDMRLFYQDVFQNRMVFAITYREMHRLAEMYRNGEDVRTYRCTLTTQIFALAKGNFEALKQMFGHVGLQSNVFVKNSFFSGLDDREAMAHGHTSLFALSCVNNIWKPGYGYQKLMSNGHAMVVSYAGSIIDGQKKIIFRDALKAYHYEDILSKDTFLFFVHAVLRLRDTSFSSKCVKGSSKVSL